MGDAVTEAIRPLVREHVSPRELAFGGLFGAAALALPALFHLIQLGHIVMPMYIPLMVLPFFVRWGVAGTTALLVPMISALVTGMPPLMPPIAPAMSIELSIMAVALALLRGHWPRINPIILLAPVLVGGRFVNAGLMYFASRILELPAGFVAGISFFAGWPGVVLMLVVVPPIALLARKLHES